MKIWENLSTLEIAKSFDQFKKYHLHNFKQIYQVHHHFQFVSRQFKSGLAQLNLYQKIVTTQLHTIKQIILSQIINHLIK